MKRNREKRLRACRGRNETVSCPVCGRRLSTSSAEAHVDACLRKSSQSNDDDDESIDVEVIISFSVYLLIFSIRS